MCISKLDINITTEQGISAVQAVTIVTYNRTVTIQYLDTVLQFGKIGINQLIKL